MAQEGSSKSIKNDDESPKNVLNNLSEAQSYQSFVSLFPHLSKSGLATNNSVPSPLPMMYKKGEIKIETEEEKPEETASLPLVIREGEKVQEVELEHGKTVFSLDNQDAKLLVDNFMSEDASEYSMDTHLPNSAINSFDPLSSYFPSSYTPSVQHVQKNKIVEIGEEENDEEEEEKEENTAANWDGGFTKINKNAKPIKTKTITDNELIMESFDDDEIVEVKENTEIAILNDVINTQPISTSDDAEFIEVEKFSIDEDFDYDNIVLARKYSPETERRLNGRFNEFEEQLNKLNVNKN